MSIAPKLESFLTEAGLDFDVISHPRSNTTMETARRSSLPRSAFAKAVIVHHIDGFAMTVVPGDRKVHLTALQDILHYRLRLASEDEIGDLFPDCDAGAVPPLGFLYGLKTIVDHDLNEAPTVCFEAGDHETIVQVSHEGFERIMRDTEHASVSCSQHAH